MGSIISLPLMAFSGMYNKLNDIPSWISWVQYISPFRYGLHMLLENQYEDLRINTVDSFYDYRDDLNIESFWDNTLFLCAVTLGFYIVTFIILKNISF